MALNYLPFLNNRVRKPTGHEPLATFTDRLASGALNYEGLPVVPDERPFFTGASRGPRADVTLPTAHPPAYRSSITLPFKTEIYNANALHVPDLISIGEAHARARESTRSRETARMYMPTGKPGLITMLDAELASLESRIAEKRFAMNRDGVDAARIDEMLGRDYEHLRQLLARREEARTGINPTTMRLERQLLGTLEMPEAALQAAEAARMAVAAGGGAATPEAYARIGAELRPGYAPASLFGSDYATRRREIDASALPTRGDPERAPALLHRNALVPAAGVAAVVDNPAAVMAQDALAANPVPAVPPGGNGAVLDGDARDAMAYANILDVMARRMRGDPAAVDVAAAGDARAVQGIALGAERAVARDDGEEDETEGDDSDATVADRMVADYIMTPARGGGGGAAGAGAASARSSFVTPSSAMSSASLTGGVEFVDRTPGGGRRIRFYD